MARTYSVVTRNEEVTPVGWKLCYNSSPSSRVFKILRERGFYANHATLEELELECERLSKFSYEEANNQDSQCSKESSSKTMGLLNHKNSHSLPSRGVTSTNIVATKSDQVTSRGLREPQSPSVELSKNSLIHHWRVSTKNRVCVPITEVPYADSNVCDGAAKLDFMLLGIFGEDQELCVAIEEWKLDLTTDLSLGIFAKTTKQVWVQLGKPEDLYEQTIRHVLIYMQLFSIIVADSELTVSMLFELLTSKFYSWKVKPNICDLQESLAFMKKFNLTCLFPLDKQVLSRVMMEARDYGESDADNGGKPLTFKRARNKWHTNVETPIPKASFDDSVKPTLLERNHPVSSGSDQESLVLNRRVKARMDTASASDLDQHEHSSPYKKDESSRCIVSTSEADFTSIEKLAATSPSEDFGDAEVPHDTCRGEEKLKVTDAQRRIHTIMMGVYNGGYGCSWGSKHEYDIEPLSTIERLWESTSKAFHALEILERGGTLEAAKHVCPVESLANISVDKDSLQAYGVHQFLPAVNRQKEVADRINYYAHDGDTVVEICSREVDYLSLLKERLMNLGKLCNYKRYVCNKSQRMDVKEWLNEQELPTGSKLLICLSLSFDLWGNQINKILDTALELKPKLIVLIAPLGSKRFDEQSAYSLIWADVELLQSEISWPWGLLEVSSDALVEGKGDSPTMFLWSRTDWATKHKQIASRFGHLKKSVSSGFKGRIVNS